MTLEQFVPCPVAELGRWLREPTTSVKQWIERPLRLAHRRR
jgi:hypothetical protein